MGTEKRKILVVDDDRSFLEEISGLLNDEGYEVNTCAESGKALSMVDSYKPHCVIMDYSMPALDGQDLLLLIQRKHAELPVIMCTGVIDINTSYLLKSGAREVLQKPFSDTALLNSIEQAVSEGGDSIPIQIKGFNLREIRDTVLRKVIVKALSRTNFNITHSASLLGISRQCLLRYIKRLQISY